MILRGSPPLHHLLQHDTLKLRFKGEFLAVSKNSLPKMWQAWPQAGRPFSARSVRRCMGRAKGRDRHMPSLQRGDDLLALVFEREVLSWFALVQENVEKYLTTFENDTAKDDLIHLGLRSCHYIGIASIHERWKGAWMRGDELYWLRSTPRKKGKD